MKTVLLTMFLTVFANAAFAMNLTEDPRFPYTGAKQAYESARSLQSKELIGKWMTTGVARKKGNSKDGYWPDGKFEIDGQPGYFMEIYDISSITDVFGNEVISTKLDLVGVETGKVYGESSFLTGYITATEVVLNYKMSGCPAVAECRMVDKLDMLLCRLSSVEEKNCSAKPAWAYIGLNRVPQPNF